VESALLKNLMTGAGSSGQFIGGVVVTLLYAVIGLLSAIGSILVVRCMFQESAFGPKRTSLAAPHMSAFGGKADMAFCKTSALDAKQLLARSRNNYHPTLFADVQKGEAGMFRGSCHEN
jgi:hypothetical protein